MLFFRILRKGINLFRGIPLAAWPYRGIYLISRIFGFNYLVTFPFVLDIIASHRCNLQCEGCQKYPHSVSDLSLDLFRSIMRECKGRVSQINFCSLGEPFLNNNLPLMLREIKAASIKCSIVTNGTLITQELAEFIIKETSITKLIFSIDGATEKTCTSYRKGLDFQKLLDGITFVANEKKKYGSKTPLLCANFVAMKRNIEELPELVKLAASLGIETVSVNYATIEAKLSMQDSLFTEPELQKGIFASAQRTALQLGVELMLPPDINDSKFFRPCRIPWDYMIIDTDGKVRLCYFSWEESVGNILSDGGIKKVWNNHWHRNVRATISSEHPFYTYCKYCGYQYGFSDIKSHEGKNALNTRLFSFRNCSASH